MLEFTNSPSFPDYTQGGFPVATFYDIRFFVYDRDDVSLFSSNEKRTIQVVNKNLPPVTNFSGGTGPFTISEGDRITFDVSATDPDGGSVTDLYAVNMPTGATLSGVVDFRIFDWTPDFTQSGQYLITFISVDDFNDADTNTIEINVIDAGNQPPSFGNNMDSSYNVFINIGTELVINASDPEGGAVTITADPILSGATFVDSGNGSAVYTYNPDSLADGSSNEITFTVTDSEQASSSMSTTLTVASFKRGDLDSDRKYTMNDIVVITNYIFRGGSIPDPIDAADIDLSGGVNVADIAYLVKYMYKSGPKPPQ